MTIGPDRAGIETLLDDAELKVWSKRPDGRRFLGVRGVPVWGGPPEIHFKGRSYRVETCISNLEMRERLHRLENDGQDAVLICDRDDRDLGDDVLGRLVKHRLHTVDAMTALRGLFGARDADPRLYRHPKLVGALVEHARSTKYPSVGIGYLSLEHAIDALLRHVLHFDADATNGGNLLCWCRSELGPKAFVALAPEVRFDVKQIMADPTRHGPLAVPVLTLVESGRTTDALAIGFALTALRPSRDSASSRGRDARLRLEGQLGLSDLENQLAEQWADAALIAYERIEATEGAAGATAAFARAEQLLANAKGQDLAIESCVLPSGLKFRLEQLGSALKTQLDVASTANVVEASAAAVLEHAGAKRDPRLVRSVEAVRRLIRWLRTTDQPAQSLAFGAMDFLEVGAWVDRLRPALLLRTDVVALDTALEMLATRVRERREAENRRFGVLIAEEGVRIVPPGRATAVEHVLDQVVARVAAERHPVLLLVFDGLSAPIFHELMESIATLGWRQMVPEPHAEDFPRLALAALPTVTEISRASLFAGAISRGDSSAEVRSFAAHPRLQSVSFSGKPPRAFHKAGVGAGGSLDPALVSALGDEKQVVVGIVLNAVDDALTKTDQLDLAFDVGLIKPLAPILEICRSIGRSIVIASDHGHVVEAGTKLANFPGGGQRWRRADSAGDGEVSLRGTRVLGDDVIAPWTESLRYTTKQAGYHGGVSPQEVVIPLAVLASVDREGWSQVDRRPPDWFQSQGARVADVAKPFDPQAKASPADLQPPARRAAIATPGDLPFDVGDSTNWLDELMDSELFRSQRKSIARLSFDDGQIRRLLTPLGERGGKSQLRALAATLGLHESRVAGMIEGLRRVLNVDGYPVLVLDAEAGDVILNLSLLREQFGT